MTNYTSKEFLEDIMSDIIIATPQSACLCSDEEIRKIINRQIKCANLFRRLRSLGLDIELRWVRVGVDNFYSVFLNTMDRLYSKHSEILKNLPEMYRESELDAFLECLEALLDAGIPISQILEDM